MYFFILYSSLWKLWSEIITVSLKTVSYIHMHYITSCKKKRRPGNLGKSSHACTIIMLIYLDLVFDSQKNFCNLLLIHLKFRFGYLSWSVHSLLG